MANKPEAGHELDALIAEKIMGWGYVNASELGWRWRYPDDASGRLYERPPMYSTDIAMAWGIVEKLCDDGYFPGVGYDDGRWEAWVFFDEPIEGDVFGSLDTVKAFAQTAPLAICRVALLVSAPKH